MVWPARLLVGHRAKTKLSWNPPFENSRPWPLLRFANYSNRWKRCHCRFQYTMFLRIILVLVVMGVSVGGESIQLRDGSTMDESHRNLAVSKAFNVSLFLELQFLSQTTASRLENNQEGNPAVLGLCNCVKEQVGNSLQERSIFLSLVLTIVSPPGQGTNSLEHGLPTRGFRGCHSRFRLSYSEYCSTI